MESAPGDQYATGWDGFEAQCGRCGVALWIIVKTKQATLKSARDAEQAKPKREFIEVTPGSGHYREVIAEP